MSEAVAVFPEVYERKSKYRVEDFDTLQPTRVMWRVKGLWPSTGLCFLGGPSMTGKTFFPLDACARVCRGEQVLGRKSVAAGVVYVGAEDPGGIRLRIDGLRREIGPLRGRFKFIGQAPELIDPEDVDDLKVNLEEIQREFQARGMNLGVVVIDTMSAVTPGVDENTAKDMGPVLKALQEMSLSLETLILMIAHTGKDADKGIRGWSGLLANADGLVMLEDPLGSPVRPGTVVKVKNGSAGDRFAFTLKQVVVGHDDDGDEITTCVIEATDAPERAKGGRAPTKAGGDAELIMRAYGRLFDNSNNHREVNAPGAEGVTGLDVGALRQEAIVIGLGDAEPDYIDCADDAARKREREKWLDSRKKAFNRGLTYLRDQRRLRTENGLAWEPTKKRGVR